MFAEGVKMKDRKTLRLTNTRLTHQARGAEEVDMSGILRERDTLQQERDFFRSQYNDLSRRMAQLTATGPTISQTLVNTPSAVLFGVCCRVLFQCH